MKLSNFKKISKISNKNHLRNRKGRIEVASKSHPIVVGMKKIRKRPKKILEIGCSTGFILERIRQLTNSSCFGLDTSAMAIKEGKKIFPKLRLFHGEFSSHKLNKKKYDLIIFGFFLFMVSPNDVFELFFKANNSLKENGHIIIYDFKSKKNFIKKNYKYSKLVKVYKWDFKNFFLALPSYKILFNKKKFFDKKFAETELSVIKKVKI